MEEKRFLLNLVSTAAALYMHVPVMRRNTGRAIMMPKIIDDLPRKCDTCGAGRSELIRIEETAKRPLGTFRRTIGYHCLECGTSHLYQLTPKASEQ